MIQVKTKINKQMIDELVKPQFITYCTSLTIGILGLFAYAFVPESVGFWKYAILWISSLAFAFGLVFLIILQKQRKKDEAKTNEGNEYDFNEDHVMIKEICNGEVVSESKLYYSKIVRTKETEHYFFMYPNRFMAMPIAKEGLSPQDLTLLRAILKNINRKTP